MNPLQVDSIQSGTKKLNNLNRIGQHYSRGCGGDLERLGSWRPHYRLHHPSALIRDFPEIRRSVLIGQWQSDLQRSCSGIAQIFQETGLFSFASPSSPPNPHDWISIGNSFDKCFFKQGFPCPKYSNPADHVMRLMSRLESTDEEYQERVDKFSEYRKKNNNLISISDKEKSRNIDLSAVPVFTNKGAWFTSQYYYLLRRSWSQYVRDPGTTTARYRVRIYLFLETNNNLNKTGWVKIWSFRSSRDFCFCSWDIRSLILPTEQVQSSPCSCSQCSPPAIQSSTFVSQERS